MKKALFSLLLCLPMSAQMVSWTQRGYDDVHSGYNPHETRLTQNLVKTQGVTMQAPIPVIGDKLGLESQPLIDANAMFPNNVTHSVMILPSMANVVRGVDALTGESIWQTTLGVPVKGPYQRAQNNNTLIDIYGINDHFGCEATGVIDTDTHRWYSVCQVSPDGSGDALTSRFYMYVLDTRTGKNVVAPVLVDGSGSVNGHGVPQDFNSAMRKVRSSAVMYRGNGRKDVIQCSGSVYMLTPGVTGFCFAFDTNTNKFTSFIATTQGRAGNVWMSGGAPALMDGKLYLVTATGGFDGVSQFSESLLEMTDNNGVLYFDHHFTPYTDRVRTGQDKQNNLQLKHFTPADAVNNLSISDKCVSAEGNSCLKITCNPLSLKKYPDWKLVDCSAPTNTSNDECVEIEGTPCTREKCAPEYLRTHPAWKMEQCKAKAENTIDGMPNMLSGANPSTRNFGPPVNGHAMAMPDLKHATVKLAQNSRGELIPLMYPPIATGGIFSDEDLGSAQETCFPGSHLCIVGGKDGIAYPVNTNNMGDTMPVDLRNPKAVCAKLAAPPVWATVDPGPADPCPMDTTQLNFLPWGDTAHIHMPPVHFYDPVLKSNVMFVWGENQQLHEWAISPTGAMTYVRQGKEYASNDVRSLPGGGMTGGFCAASSNGNDPNSFLLACVIPTGDANKSITNGRLLIYDPIHPDSQGYIQTIWDSQQWGIGFKFNKFMPPMIDGGEIVYATFDGRVLLFR